MVIVGGGFAGVEVARRLGDRADVTLVSDDNFLLFTPMLAEVGAGDIEPRHIVSPIRQLCPDARIVIARAESVDVAARAVTVTSPVSGETSTLSGDALVVTTGSVPRTFGVDGVERHTLGFKDMLDALRIRRRVLALLEAATAHPDPRLTSIVVVGAGYSGAELVAALADFLADAAPKYYADAPAPRLTLVDALDRVVPALSERLSERAATALEARGVELRLGTEVAAVGPSGVELADGTSIDAATVIWAAGVRAGPLAAELDGEPGSLGRARVDGNLQVAPGVFALGDVAEVPGPDGEPNPPTAQHALRQARYLARHLPALLAGEQVAPFRYRTMGQLVSLGHHNAVGELFGVPVSGFVAWFLWRTYYLWQVPTLLRKTRVALDWTLDLIFPPDIAELPSADIGPLPDLGITDAGRA